MPPKNPDRPVLSEALRRRAAEIAAQAPPLSEAVRARLRPLLDLTGAPRDNPDDPSTDDAH